MPNYLIQASYTDDGLKGVLAKGREPSTSPSATPTPMSSSTCRTTSVAAAAMTVSASGATHAKTTVLLTPADVDEAAKRSVDYVPPGG
jgi:hypothetical protein